MPLIVIEVDDMSEDDLDNLVDMLSEMAQNHAVDCYKNEGHVKVGLLRTMGGGPLP